MGIAGRLACGLLVACALAGCAAIERPELVSRETLPLKVLTEAINCEIRNTVADQIADHPWLASWQGQYSITLKANQISALKATTNTFPISLPKGSLLNFGVGAGVTGTANRTAVYKFNVEFKDMVGKPPCVSTARPDGHPFLQGEIGFRSWMDRALQASGPQGGAGGTDKLASIGHTFEFIVDYNAAVSPSFVLMPAPVANVNPTASFERMEDNIVDVSFGKVPPATATVTDIARILNAQQKNDVAAAKDKARSDAETVARNTADLEKPENKAILQMVDRVEELKGQMALEQFRADPSIARAVEEQTARLKPQSARAAELLRKRRETRAAQADGRDQRETIRDINADPKLTQTTSRQIPVRATALSPDANPNVAGTLLQLQLERLITQRPGGL